MTDLYHSLWFIDCIYYGLGLWHNYFRVSYKLYKIMNSTKYHPLHLTEFEIVVSYEGLLTIPTIYRVHSVPFVSL